MVYRLYSDVCVALDDSQSAAWYDGMLGDNVFLEEVDTLLKVTEIVL